MDGNREDRAQAKPNSAWIPQTAAIFTGLPGEGLPAHGSHLPFFHSLHYPCRPQWQLHHRCSWAMLGSAIFSLCCDPGPPVPVTPDLQDLEGQKEHRQTAQQKGLVFSKAKQDRPGHVGREGSCYHVLARTQPQRRTASQSLLSRPVFAPS